MSVFTPGFAKFPVASGAVQQVYQCPADKTHAYVDMNFFKQANPGTSLIAVALSTEPNPANLTSVDYFIDDIQLIDSANTGSLEKVLVGTNERLYVWVVSGADIAVRVASFEESNVKVQKAGRLAALATTDTNINLIYNNAATGIAYIGFSMTIFNKDAINTADISVWISNAATPAASDKVAEFQLTAQDTTIIENITMAPDEQIFVQSSLLNTEYFVNGMAVLS